MVNRTVAAGLIAVLLCIDASAPVLADNQMGYQLLSASQAASLPNNGGALGMDIGRSQIINDQGLSFELLRVNAVRPGSPGEQAGLKPGDQIIAVDGRVFPSVATFAAYVGSVLPGRQISMDTIPAGGGPQQAQRIGVTVGSKGLTVPPQQTGQTAGLSTGTKIAIGVGAAALFGCYKAGCFSRLKTRLGGPSQQLQPAQ